MLTKDILQLVFLELESGHDMINFSEISRKCYQIFHQQIEVVHIPESRDAKKNIMMKNKRGQNHGLDRWWHANGQLLGEDNYFYNKMHGLERTWYQHGPLWYETRWLHGKKHGYHYDWYPGGRLMYKRNYYHGQLQIEN